MEIDLKFKEVNGFTEEETIELRTGKATFDPKLDALVTLVISASSVFMHA